MGKKRSDFLDNSDIIKLIQKECRYHKYEVEDVYEAFLRVAQKLMLENKEFVIGNIIYVEYAPGQKRKFWSSTKQEFVDSIGGIRCKPRIATRFQNKIRDLSIGRITLDEALAISDGEQQEDDSESDITVEEQQ